MIIDIVIAFDSAVNGEERSLKSFGNRGIKVTPLFFAHVEDDVGRILDSAHGAILFDVIVQNRHFLDKEKRQNMR